MKRFFKYSLAVVVTFLSVMWLSSYTFYNSIGVDVSHPSQNGFTTIHYRIRWPGNGAFWVGWIAREYLPKKDSKIELDLGGAIFQPPAGPEIKSVWQWLGFWWIDKHEVESNFTKSSGLINTWENWLGIPSWLLPIFGRLLWVLKY